MASTWVNKRSSALRRRLAILSSCQKSCKNSLQQSSTRQPTMHTPFNLDPLTAQGTPVTNARMRSLMNTEGMDLDDPNDFEREFADDALQRDPSQWSEEDQQSIWLVYGRWVQPATAFDDLTLYHNHTIAAREQHGHHDSMEYDVSSCGSPHPSHQTDDVLSPLGTTYIADHEQNLEQLIDNGQINCKARPIPPGSNPFVCTGCGKSFESGKWGNVKRHVALKLIGPRFLTICCEHLVRCHNNALKHYEKLSNIGLQYRCTRQGCDKVLAIRKSDMVIVCQAKHEHPNFKAQSCKGYPCRKCKHTFTTKDDLRRHIRTCTQLK